MSSRAFSTVSGEAGVCGLSSITPHLSLSCTSMKRACAHSSFMSIQITPISLRRDFFEGNVCTAFAHRLISQLARSCTLLVRSLMWYSKWKSK